MTGGIPINFRYQVRRRKRRAFFLERIAMLFKSFFMMMNFPFPGMLHEEKHVSKDADPLVCDRAEAGRDALARALRSQLGISPLW